VKLIQRLRPYGGGNRILAQLHGLDIIDKHRLVLVVGAANKQLIIKLKVKVSWSDKPVEGPQFALSDGDRQFPLEDGEEVFRECAAARSTDSMSDHAVVFELAFGDNSEVRGHALIPTLEEMHAYVARVVDMFERQLNPLPSAA
jgi:hypothetical protein